MKILFYDVKEFEFNCILNQIPDNIEPYFFKYSINQSTYIDEKYKDAEALCVFVGSKLNEIVLSRFKILKYIFLRCSGYSNVDLNYCKRRDIKIFYVPAYGVSTVAEYAFGLILSLSRKIIKAQNDLKEGEINHDELMGFQLDSKTIGVIGLGNIGRRIVEIAHGFNMNTLVYDINQNIDYTYSELDELYKNSDIIIISCPLTPETKGMINHNSLNKMKKSAVLINIARGEIVNTKALAEALVKRKISGAALDVIECEETLCDLWNFCLNTDKRESCLKKFLFIQKLKTMPNVIITPHIAYNTKEAVEEIINITMDNIQSSFQINSDTKNLIVL